MKRGLLKNSKSLAALLLCIIFILSASGCGGSSPSAGGSATPAPTTGAAQTQTPEATPVDYSAMEPLKVSFTGIAWGNGAEENGAMEQAFEKMLNLDMDVTWISYEDYRDRINMQMAAANLTDVTQIYPKDGKTFYPQVADAIDNTMFWDLTPYIIDNGFKDSNEIMKNWSDEVWENSSYKGKLYAIPRRLADSVPNAGILVRKDLMEKTGITQEPTTVEELGDFIIAMHKATGLYGLDFSTNDFESAQIKQIAVAFTGIQDWGIDVNGDFYYQSFAKEYDNFLLWVKKLYDAGAIDPEFVLNQTANSSFVGGKSCVKMHTWYVWNQSADLVTKKYFDKSVEDTAQVWGMLPVKGEKSYTLSINYGAGYDNPVMISKSVKEENLPRIIDALCRTDEAYLKMLNYGIEGLHYTLDTDGVTLLPTTDEQAVAKKAGYVGGWNQILLATDPDFIQEKFVKSESSPETIARAEEISKLSKQYAQEIGLSCPALTLQSKTYNERWVSLVQDLNDNKALVVMGKMSVEQWDSYVDGIVQSADYKAIQKEFKEARAASK